MPLLIRSIALLAVLIGAPLTTRAADFDHTHAAWDAILQAQVRDGFFDYATLNRDRAPLDAYLAQLAAPSADDVNGWTRDQQLAYYINAYNAYTIASILDAYPVDSIRDIDGVWKKRKHAVAGTQLTLDQIEHERLRAQLKEPRIHAAVNCASIGCPPLGDRAYTATDMDQQLDAAMRAMVASPNSFRYDAKAQKVHLSKIFEWFGDDFKAAKGPLTSYGKYNGVMNAILPYLPKRTASAITATKPKLTWIDYDWSLNQAK